MEINKLQYPVGTFEFPASFTSEEIKAWITEIALFPFNIRKAVSGLSPDQLQVTYRPRGWTVAQVVNHCADSHINAFIRFKLALTEEEPVIKPYAENLWAQLADGLNGDLEPSLQILEGVHKRWVYLMSTIDQNDWSRVYFHPEQNRKISLWAACAMYAWHCRHHLAHVCLAVGSDV